MRVDLSDLAPVLTVVATGAATLAGVWLNGRNTARTEAARLAAEERSEQTRLQREDASTEREREQSAAVAASVLADSIASRFAGELRTVREFEEIPEEGFVEWYDAQWKTHSGIQFRQEIGRVLDTDARNRLLEVVDCVDEYEELGLWDFREPQPKVDELLTLGFDVASTLARRQEPDAMLSKRVDAMRKTMRDWSAYQREERKIAHDAMIADAARRKREAATKAAKSE